MCTADVVPFADRVCSRLNAVQAAMMSCVIFTEKGEEAMPLTDELRGPLRQLQDAARRIATVQQDSGLTVDVEEYVQKFRPDMMELVAAWCTGAKFSELCNMTKQYEGTIIRVIRRCVPPHVD